MLFRRKHRDVRKDTTVMGLEADRKKIADRILEATRNPTTSEKLKAARQETEVRIHILQTEVAIYDEQIAFLEMIQERHPQADEMVQSIFKHLMDRVVIDGRNSAPPPLAPLNVPRKSGG